MDFKTQYSYFKYQIILFKLTNILTIFQKYINKILVEKLNVFIIIYLKNILIYTNNKKEGHIQAVQWVLNQLRKYLLYANLKNCRFY